MKANLMLVILILQQRVSCEAPNSLLGPNPKPSPPPPLRLIPGVRQEPPSLPSPPHRPREWGGRSRRTDVVGVPGQQVQELVVELPVVGLGACVLRLVCPSRQLELVQGASTNPRDQPSPIGPSVDVRVRVRSLKDRSRSYRRSPEEGPTHGQPSVDLPSVDVRMRDGDLKPVFVRRRREEIGEGVGVGIGDDSRHESSGRRFEDRYVESRYDEGWGGGRGGGDQDGDRDRREVVGDDWGGGDREGEGGDDGRDREDVLDEGGGEGEGGDREDRRGTVEELERARG